MHQYTVARRGWRNWRLTHAIFGTIVGATGKQQTSATGKWVQKLRLLLVLLKGNRDPCPVDRESIPARFVATRLSGATFESYNSINN